MMRIEPFTFAGLPSRVIFGSGTLAQVGTEIARLGRKRALVLSTPNQRADAEALALRLGNVAAGVFAEAAMHTPLEVTERALAAFKERRLCRCPRWWLDHRSWQSDCN